MLKCTLYVFRSKTSHVEMDKKGSFAVAQNCAVVNNLIWPICVEYPRHIGLLCKLQHLRSMYQVYRV